MTQAAFGGRMVVMTCK